MSFTKYTNLSERNKLSLNELIDAEEENGNHHASRFRELLRENGRLNDQHDNWGGMVRHLWVGCRVRFWGDVVSISSFAICLIGAAIWKIV